MIRIAVIFESSPFDRKGLFNAVHNRIRHLAAAGGCQIDVYCVHSRDNAFTRRIRKTPVTPDVESVTIDGINYRMLWYRFSILDHCLLEKLHVRPWNFPRFMKKTLECLKGYDCISAHSLTGGLFAEMASRHYGVPYFVTWHGSDVHTHPWRNPVLLEDTRRVMQGALSNFFVSNTLKAVSERITVKARKEVLYNGVSKDFRQLSEGEVAAARERYGLTPDDKVVAFAGNLSPVKNVLSLPGIFKGISDRYAGPVKFWIAGDGKQRKALEASVQAAGLDVRFFGNVPSSDMPAIMNCIDVLVLPSLNEGLPLVCAEALCCGAAVVGAEAGGIPEVIGLDNVVPHGDGFEAKMAKKAVEMLSGQVEQAIPDELDWNRTALQEKRILESFLSKGE